VGVFRRSGFPLSSLPVPGLPPVLIDSNLSPRLLGDFDGDGRGDFVI